MPSKEVKAFTKQLEEQYGKAPPDLKQHALVKGKEKIYLVSRDVEKLALDQVNINNLGLYIAEIKKELRLSIEGAQYAGPHATKNVCDIDKEQLKEWLKGEDIPIDGTYEGFVILKHGDDYVGSGKFKEGKIANFVPKARRLQEVH